MRFSPHVHRLLELLEAKRYRAYRDSGGVWTNGIGHTLGVVQGQTATEEEVQKWLSQDLMVVDAVIKRYVTRDLSQPVLDALGLFVFNVGGPQFESSTLLKLLNAGQLDEARAQLHRWVHDNGAIVDGLRVRRIVEDFVWQGHAASIDEDFIDAIRAGVV